MVVVLLDLLKYKYLIYIDESQNEMIYNGSRSKEKNCAWNNKNFRQQNEF